VEVSRELGVIVDDHALPESARIPPEGMMSAEAKRLICEPHQAI
jgi:hypothetical protein